MLLIALVDYARGNDGAKMEDVRLWSDERVTRCLSRCKKSDDALLEHAWIVEYFQYK
jgi:malonyl CoA-acyl carrier protein transacylase